jgi:hypothetical protein
VDAAMSIAEQAHAFHVTKSALHTVPLPPDVHLETFGSYMNSSSVVDGLKFDFHEHLCENWFDMNHLTIMSFHDSAGTAMPDAVTAADAAILKPVVPGPINNCRHPDVRFVRLQLVLDFRTLCTAARPADNTTLRASYYLELPQSLVVVNNGHGVPSETLLLFTVLLICAPCLWSKSKRTFSHKYFKIGLLTSSLRHST